MMRYFLTLAYRGAPFHGWQVQPGQVTVQGRLEEVLSVLVRRPVAVTGAGRTDAGVNARRMVAHLDLPEDYRFDSKVLLRSANSMLGPDIAIYQIEQVAADAHARFDATEREYRYFVTTRKNPFAMGMAWPAPPSLDFEAMNRAAALMLGIRDFTSFSKLHTDVKTNICDLRRAAWHPCPEREEMWYFEIAADRFLRNMVRAVVGTLVDVGRGKIPPQDVLRILDCKNRCSAGTSMPAEALFLWDVKY